MYANTQLLKSSIVIVLKFAHLKATKQEVVMM